MGLIHDIAGGFMSALNPVFFSEKARCALQLEQLRCFEFASIPAEVDKIFKTRAPDIKASLRCVSLASRVALDGAGAFVQAPLLELGGVSETVKARVLALMDQVRMMQTLLEVEQQGVLQQSYLLGSWFDADGDQVLVPFLPFQVEEITIHDPWARAQGDISKADRVVLVQSVQPPSSSGWQSEWNAIDVWCARVVLTRTEAYVEYPDKARVGLLAPDGSNPLGRVPLVLTRRVRPPQGLSVLPNVAMDVLFCNVGLILGLSDIEVGIRGQFHVKLIATGDDLNAFKELPNSANDILPFKGQVNVTAVHLNPATEKYQRALETVQYLISQFRYLRPEAYQASIVTGDARRQDAAGFTEERLRQETRTNRLITDTVKLLVDVANTRRGLLELAPPTISATYRYVRPPENALQEAQALSVMCAQGLLNIFREVAKADGVSVEEAKRRVMENLDDWRSVIGTAPSKDTPGLDKLAPKATTEAPPAPEDG